MSFTQQMNQGKPLEEIAAFHHHFVKESWILYGLAVFIAGIRFTARYKRFGLRGARIDDALMVLALAAFTVQTYGINKHLAQGAGISFIPPPKLARMSPEQIEIEISNAKWVYVIYHMLILTLWCAKGCMVTIYYRITDGLTARRWVVAVAIFTGLSFIGIELTLFLTCIPIERRWIPGTDMNCSLYDNYQITDAVLSCTSTFLILAVGFPVLLRARLPRRQKWIVLTLFSLGIFDLAADITAKVFLATMRSNGFVFYSWYMRVCFVALLVCNLPYTWSLLIDCFPSVRDWSTGSSHSSTPRFWKERGWHRAKSTSSRDRSALVKTPGTADTEKDADVETFVEFPKAAQALRSSNTLGTFDAKVDAAVIRHSLGEHVDDNITLDMMTSRRVFMDIESALAHVRAEALRAAESPDSNRLSVMSDVSVDTVQPRSEKKDMRG